MKRLRPLSLFLLFPGLLLWTACDDGDEESDLTRLERLILERVAGDFFDLEAEDPDA